MTFEIPTFPTSVIAQQRAVMLMVMSNEQLENQVRNFKALWRSFWDPGIDPELMQATLDDLAASTATDPQDSTVTNQLSAFFAKARRFIANITVDVPDAFADARKDESGQYTEFLTPGWKYSTEQPGRIVVTTPCTWVDNA